MKPTPGTLFPPWCPRDDPDALSRVGIAKGTTETVRQIERRCAISRRDNRVEFWRFTAATGWTMFAAAAIAQILKWLR